MIMAMFRILMPFLGTAMETDALGPEFGAPPVCWPPGIELAESFAPQLAQYSAPSRFFEPHFPQYIVFTSNSSNYLSKKREVIGKIRRIPSNLQQNEDFLAKFQQVKYRRFDTHR